MLVTRCTVCHRSFHTGKEWLNHLLQDDHQVMARKAILKWGKAERGCAFIIYSTFPVARLEMLQFFCKESEVIDFVYFPSQPEIGFIQLESKKEAKEVFARVKGPSLKICDQPVELRKGWKCLELEWKERLSSLSPDSWSPSNNVSGNDKEGHTHNCAESVGKQPQSQKTIPTPTSSEASSILHQQLDSVREKNMLDESANFVESPLNPRKKRLATAPKKSPQPDVVGGNTETDDDDCQIISPPRKTVQHYEIISLEVEEEEVSKVKLPTKKKRKSKSASNLTADQLLEDIFLGME